MDFVITNKPSNFKERNSLLQDCLRPKNVQIPIELEYPTVLDPSANKYSYCIECQNEIIAHANLFPRKIVDSSNRLVASVGLIGNVATKSSWQGKGFMRDLLNHLVVEARRLDLEGLILWSDLDKFYHKLGFETLGLEWRFQFPHLPKFVQNRFIIRNAGELTDGDYQRLIDLQPHSNFRIQRSIPEFRKLLAIPHTYLLTQNNNEISGYAVCGKGFDMTGVIHEWGVQNPADLIFASADVQAQLGYISNYVLAPGQTTKSFLTPIKKYAKEFSQHPMCFAKALKNETKFKNAIRQSFIWGLDSI